MDCLVSLLWQFEVPDIPILPTLLKNKQENSHHYFYSQKQRRVLRKKNPNAIAFLEESQKSPQQKQSPQLLHTTRNRDKLTMMLQLSTGANAAQNLENPEFEGQYSIISPNYQLCLYRKNQKETEIEHITVPFYSSADIEDKIGKFVDRLCAGLGSSIESKMKLVKGRKIVGDWGNGVADIGVVVGIDTEKEQIVAVDVLRLTFIRQIPTIVPINYTPMVSLATKPGKPLLKQPQKQQLTHQTIPIAFSKIQQTKQSAQTVECQCCLKSVLSSQTKQIENQQYKKLRKIKNESIRGLTDPYYQVCQECYLLL